MRRIASALVVAALGALVFSGLAVAAATKEGCRVYTWRDGPDTYEEVHCCYPSFCKWWYRDCHYGWCGYWKEGGTYGNSGSWETNGDWDKVCEFDPDDGWRHNCVHNDASLPSAPPVGAPIGISRLPL